MKIAHTLTIPFAIGLVAFAAANALATEGVSPGAVDRMAQVNNACPTFSWEGSTATSFYEIVAYAIHENDDPATADLTAESEVLYTRISGAATSWTPSAEQCFAPGGRYVWFVRAASELAGDEAVATSEWSAGRYFTVPAAPSVDEVARALEVLQRYVAQGGDAQVIASTAAPAAGGNLTAPLKGGEVGGPKSVTTASAAIRGEHPSLTGEAYGVVGVSSAENGAGVAAAHLDGGPDLVLDGSAEGLADALIWEWGMDRHSTVNESFSFLNTGGGMMTLQVEGTVAADALDCPDCVGSSDIADGAVSSSDLASGAVTSTKIATGAVGANAIHPGEVDSTHLADEAVTNAKIAPGAVDSSSLEDAAVTTTKIAAGAVGANAIHPGQVDSSHLAAEAVTTDKIADAAVTSAKIAPGAVDTSSLEDAAVTGTKLASGSVSASSLRNNAVTTDKIADGTISAADLSPSLALDADTLDGQHGAFYLDAGNLIGGPLSDTVFSAYGDLSHEGRLDNADDLDLPTRVQADGRFVNTDGDVMSGMLRMENDGIELALTATAADEATADIAKLQMRNSGNLTVFRLDSEGDVSATSFTGDGSGLTGVASGDVECPGCVETDDLADAAVTATKIATGAVTATRIADGSVTGPKISASAVTGDKIADGAVTAAKLAPGAIGAGSLADGSVTSATIADGAIATVDLANGAVTGTKIANGTVTADDLATAAVTAAKIQDGAIAGSKIATAAVTEQKILGNAVTEAKLAYGAVTSTKIATGAVTAAKVASAEIQLRISGQCTTGSAIRTVATDGSVTCEAAGGGDLTPPVTIDGTNNVFPILSVSNGGVRPAIAGVSAGSSGVSGRSDSAGDAGVEGSATAIDGLGVKGAASGSDGIALYGEATGPGGTGVKGLGFSQGGFFESTDLSGGIGIVAKGGASGRAAVFMGNVAVKDRDTGDTVIELGKGLDYAEGFDVSDAEPLEAGTVLIIDPETPGELMQSTRAYDTRVAGIIAGANGLGSGVRLGAEGFEHDVALAGRVYCKVDATEAGIRPGDLLTTSPIPGHAMKATDFDRARGAILGKAMEPLAAGTTGQVLVLVGLQ